MTKNLMLSIVLIGVFAGCSNLMQAEPANRVLAGVHEFGATALAFTPDGQRLISGGFRGELRIWDAGTQRPLGELRGHRAAVRAILPLPSGDLVSGDDDGRLILWDGANARARSDGAGVTALALFQGQVVSAHDDAQLRVWSADGLKLLHTLPVDGRIAALSAHGDRLAIGLARAILLLDADFRTRETLRIPNTPHDLQFSPDGRLLAAGSWFRLNVWDLASGAFRSVPTEHHGLLASIAFSPDGRYLASVGRHTDSAVRVLDMRDFRVVHRYQGHDRCGAAIRFSPDGRTLATASDDESVRLYRLGEARYPTEGATPSAH
jgi:WD40 repeat protein